MRARASISLVACAVIAWCAALDGLTSAAEPSPELVLLVTQQEAKVKQEVQQPFEAAVAALNQKYGAAVDQVQQSAIRAGKLDDAVALKTEKENVAAGKRVPVIDDDATLPALKPLRATYRTTLSQLDADRLRKLRPLQDAFARSLDGLIASFTRQGKLREATELRQHRETLIAGAPLSSLEGGPPPGAGQRALGNMSIKLPGSTLKQTPFVVGAVKAGDIVTVTPKLVRWSGGGSKKGQYCDWRGHNPDSFMRNGIPWMALVAAVSGREFWARDGTLKFTAPNDGDLVLYANDDVGGNDGEADVAVSVAPK